MYEPKQIHLMVMGGTIDSHWDGKKDTAIMNEQSAIAPYFKELILYVDLKVSAVCLKDSREIGEEDLQALLKEIEESSSTLIVVTHGTYTMPDTARYLKYTLKRKDQTIVFTGSMVPLLGFSSNYSDATYNLGYAFAKTEDLPPGIYLAMNGRVFDPDGVGKNLKEGKFYSVFDLIQ